MSLQSAEVFKLRVPLGRTIGDNNCAYDAFDVAAVKLTSTEGHAGWGFGEKVHGGTFAKPVSWKSDMETETDLQGQLSSILGELEGKEIEELLQELPFAWHEWKVANHLHAAIRMALWDLKGKEAGKPLYKLHWGDDTPDNVFSYASPCGFPQTTEWVVEHFTAKVKSGFPAIKVKVGNADIDLDMDRLKRVREAVGPEVEINVDGNTAWDGPGTLRWIERSIKEGLNLGYVEDPMWPDDLDGYRLLAKESPLPIIGHDYIPDPQKLRPLLDTGAIDRLRLRDGIDFAIETSKVAKEYNIKLIQCNTFGEHSIHFSLGSGQLDRMEFADLGWNDLFIEPVKAVNGRLTDRKSVV